MGAQQRDQSLNTRRYISVGLSQQLIFRATTCSAGATIVIGAAVADLPGQSTKCASRVTLIAETAFETGAREIRTFIALAGLGDESLESELGKFVPELLSSLFLIGQEAALIGMLALIERNLLVPKLDSFYNGLK